MEPQLLERIRRHAGALDEAAPPIELDDVRLPTVQAHRRRPARSLLVTAAAAVLVVVGLVGIDLARSGDPEPSGAPPLPLTTLDTGRSTAFDHAYRLDLPGARAVLDDSLTVRSIDGAVWRDGGSETYLSLVVRRGLASGYPEPVAFGATRELDEFPATLGRAWVTDLPDDEVATPFVVKIWWTRPDGDVWLLTSHWYEPGWDLDAAAVGDTMAGWATRIAETADPDVPFGLDGAPGSGWDMELLFSQRDGQYRSRTQVWDVDGHEVVLAATEQATASGLGNLLDAAPLAPVVVAGQPGWIARTDDGEVRIGWATASPGLPASSTSTSWSTIRIPAELAERVPEIIDSIDRSGVHD